eukprot:2017318-Rhodomonas_salina.1
MGTPCELQRVRARGQGGDDDAGEPLTGLEDMMQRLEIKHFAFRGLRRGRERAHFVQENDPRYYNPFKQYYAQKAREDRLRQKREHFTMPLVPRVGQSPVEGQAFGGDGAA